MTAVYNFSASIEEMDFMAKELQKLRMGNDAELKSTLQLSKAYLPLCPQNTENCVAVYSVYKQHEDCAAICALSFIWFT